MAKSLGTTDVSIGPAEFSKKLTLAFGRDYHVRLAVNLAPIQEDAGEAFDGVLISRAANGDLLFEEIGHRGKRRVRARQVIAIETIVIRPGESDEDALARIDRSHFTADLLGTDEGQALLDRIGRADASKRGGRTIEEALEPDPEPEKPAADVIPFRPSKSAALRLTKKGREKLAKATAGAKGVPYSERNQVWRCGTCKRRTRAAFCANGHEPVYAPAGKRKDSR